MKKFIFYPTLLFLITLCSVPLSGKSTLSNNYNINDEGTYPPPKITSYTYYTNVKKGGDVRMEGIYEPRYDPNLILEIYFNGKPLPMSSRFKMTLDFGYFSLYIKQTMVSDSGYYTFYFRNKYGEAEVTCILIVEETE